MDFLLPKILINLVNKALDIQKVNIYQERKQQFRFFHSE